MNSILDPSLWSQELVRQYRQRGQAVMHRGLDARDHWNGEEPGDYAEPVAWAGIFGISIATVQRLGNEEFVIFTPQSPHRTIPLCSPRALLEQLKRYANDYLVETT